MATITSDAAGMTGLEQLRAMLKAGRPPSIGVSLQFDAIEFDDGFALFTGVPGEHAYNPFGTIHGGYAATLLDSACGCAAHSKLVPGQTCTTLELKVAYHRAMTKDTGAVRAEGRVVTMGRRTVFTEAKLTDTQGRLCASATSTLLITSPQG